MANNWNQSKQELNKRKNGDSIKNGKMNGNIVVRTLLMAELQSELKSEIRYFIYLNLLD